MRKRKRRKAILRAMAIAGRKQRKRRRKLKKLDELQLALHYLKQAIALIILARQSVKP